MPARDEEHRLHEQAAAPLSLAIRGELLVSGSSDGTVRLWDTKARKQIKPIMTRS